MSGSSCNSSVGLRKVAFANVEFEIDIIDTRLLPGFRCGVPGRIGPVHLFELVHCKATPCSNLCDLAVAVSAELEAKCTKPPGLPAQHMRAQQAPLPIVLGRQGLSLYDCQAQKFINFVACVGRCRLWSHPSQNMPLPGIEAYASVDLNQRLSRSICKSRSPSPARAGSPSGLAPTSHQKFFFVRRCWTRMNK